jgi:hypothetical protein
MATTQAHEGRGENMKVKTSVKAGGIIHTD